MKIIKIQGGGKFSVLRKLYDGLDINFKNEIDRLIGEDCNYSSLLRLLKISSPSLLSPLVGLLINKYQPSTQNFYINGHPIHMTLEDVLYITGLPIRGKPVIADNTRDTSAFQRVFGIKTTEMTTGQLRKIAKSVNQPHETRMKAILLLVVECVIIPKGDGTKVHTTYVQFIEDLGEVNTFAWGAALLAFLQYHIENMHKRKSICGCLWVLLGFFLLRIERLRNEINVQLPMENLRVPFLVQILEAVNPISNNHKRDYDPVDELLNSLTLDDFLWKPYNTDMLPPALQDQAEYGTFVGPIFCNNYVVNHEPYRFHLQFEVGLVPQATHLPPIEYHDNRGGSGAPNFRKHYERELSLWENGLKLTYSKRNRRVGDEGADGGSTTHNSQQNSSLIWSSKTYSNTKSIKSTIEKTSTTTEDDFDHLKDYFDSVDRRESASQLFRQSLYKRSKVFDTRKSSSILPRDARVRRWAIKKSEINYKKAEKFITLSLKKIMNENTFDFLVPKVEEIEEKIKSGYYLNRGLRSVKEDLSRIYRDVIKRKNRGEAGNFSRLIKLFSRLATRLDRDSKIMKNMKNGDESSAGLFHAPSKYKNKEYISRSDSMYSINDDLEENSSSRDFSRRFLKLNKKSRNSGSDISDEFDQLSELIIISSDSESSASETKSGSEFWSETSFGESKGNGHYGEDDTYESVAYECEWGACMTKASRVPPVTRKYEVIDHYVIVADDEEVRRKMQVSLPEGYSEKLKAQKSSNEDLDMEIPEVKNFQPRKTLADEVLEQEVYGIDPYTHNLVLDSMPEELDWSLIEKHLFIEDVVLRTLNKQVRRFTGSGSTPMMYFLKPVIEEIQKTAVENRDMRTSRMCQGILKAMASRPDDKYVAYRKGLGVVCNKYGGFGVDDFIVDFLGEVYPAWRCFEKQDGIRHLQKNSTDPAPEFYNIYLERPKGDADGYDLVVVDAMHKANYASRICHSCRPNCEAKVTAVDGHYQIGIYAVREIQYGEEISFDYNSVTESKEEYEVSVCLCGSQVCRGSYLNLTGEGAFEMVLEEWHGILDRHKLIIQACELNSVSEKDYIVLGKAGLGSCLLAGLPDWLIAYTARLVRFINKERIKLPEEILKHNVEEKRKYLNEISIDVEKSDAEIQAEGVYNQRLQNLALTLDKVATIKRCIEEVKKHS